VERNETHRDSDSIYLKIIRKEEIWMRLFSGNMRGFIRVQTGKRVLQDVCRLMQGLQFILGQVSFYDLLHTLSGDDAGDAQTDILNPIFSPQHGGYGQDTVLVPDNGGYDLDQGQSDGKIC
jgi:hypothetical protein